MWLTSLNVCLQGLFNSVEPVQLALGSRTASHVYSPQGSRTLTAAAGTPRTSTQEAPLAPNAARSHCSIIDSSSFAQHGACSSLCELPWGHAAPPAAPKPATHSAKGIVPSGNGLLVGEPGGAEGEQPQATEDERTLAGLQAVLPWRVLSGHASGQVGPTCAGAGMLSCACVATGVFASELPVSVCHQLCEWMHAWPCRCCCGTSQAERCSWCACLASQALPFSESPTACGSSTLASPDLTCLAPAGAVAYMT